MFEHSSKGTEWCQRKMELTFYTEHCNNLGGIAELSAHIN